MIIDIEKLRSDVLDYYGTAMHNGFGMAVINLGQIENASNDEIINIARKIGLDFSKYAIEDDLEK